MTIQEQLGAVQEQFSGEFAVYAEHLETGEVIAFGAVEEPHLTASVMKLPVLVEALSQCHQGIHRLDELLEYRADDFVPGSGVLKDLTAGLRLPFRDALMLMMTISDNLATNMVLRTVGIDQVNRLCREWGLTQTVVHRKIAFDQPGPLAFTTPVDLVQLLKGIYHETMLDPQSSAIAMDMLARQEYNTLLTRQMPYELLEGTDDEAPLVKVLSKSGWDVGVVNDAGLVMTPWGDYAIAIMSEHCQDHRFHVDQEAHVLLPYAARAVFDHFVPESERHR